MVHIRWVAQLPIVPIQSTVSFHLVALLSLGHCHSGICIAEDGLSPGKEKENMKHLKAQT